MFTSERVTLPALLLVLLSAGCLDSGSEPAFDETPGLAGGFLGYAENAAGVTFCGNCHAAEQAAWKQTAHAGAWATLQASGAAQSFCRPCHTVNALGNAVTDSATGWVAVPEPRYQDVQCESCHGPGLEHLNDPAGAPLMAAATVGTDATTGCGECHRGTHHPFVEEWSVSAHANASGLLGNLEACRSCHGGRGALAAFGVTGSYLEATTTEPLAIVCIVCHDPHDATNPAQLRFPVSVASEEENLCMRCHRRRGQPDPSTSAGPHAPEGPLLLGEAGWWPPNTGIEPGPSTHGSDANPHLCAGCHVNAFDVRDAETDAFLVRATGHRFEALPCVDDQGVPTGAADCALTERNFSACADAGCHSDESTVRTVLTSARANAADLIAELDSLLAQVPSSEFNVDGTYTVAEGARFNSQLAARTGSVVHNPFLIDALLRASITAVKDEYGL